MRLMQLIWFGLGFVVLAPLLLPYTTLAQENIIVQIESLDGPGVSGTATLSGVGEGTHVVLDIIGLTPGATIQSSMHAGTCAMPSASFASLPESQADVTGNAMVAGSILFRGTEEIGLVTMTDGEHILVIQGEGVIACGVIPELAILPASLPETGGVASSQISILVSVFGFCLLCIGLFLRHHSRFWYCF